MNHTPMPWIIRKKDNEVFIFSTKKKESIALLLGDDNDEEVGSVGGMADARHIIHCVNTHDILVEALRNAGNVLADLVVGDLRKITKDSPALAQIRQALALVEKGV